MAGLVWVQAGCQAVIVLCRVELVCLALQGTVGTNWLIAGGESVSALLC